MKLKIYEQIPSFDENTQYVVQKEPIEMEDCIFIGCEVKELDLTETPMETHVEVSEPYIPEPSDKEKIANLETLVLELMGVV
jgi:hypothetical protein